MRFLGDFGTGWVIWTSRRHFRQKSRRKNPRINLSCSIFLLLCSHPLTISRCFIDLSPLYIDITVYACELCVEEESMRVCVVFI